MESIDRPAALPRPHLSSTAARPAVLAGPHWSRSLAVAGSAILSTTQLAAAQTPSGASTACVQAVTLPSPHQLAQARAEGNTLRQLAPWAESALWAGVALGLLAPRPELRRVQAAILATLALATLSTGVISLGRALRSDEPTDLCAELLALPQLFRHVLYVSVGRIAIYGSVLGATALLCYRSGQLALGRAPDHAARRPFGAAVDTQRYQDHPWLPDMPADPIEPLRPPMPQ